MQIVHTAYSHKKQTNKQTNQKLSFDLIVHKGSQKFKDFQNNFSELFLFLTNHLATVLIKIILNKIA